MKGVYHSVYLKNNIIIRLANRTNITVHINDLNIFKVIVVLQFITYPPNLIPHPPPPYASYYELPPTLVPIEYAVSALVTQKYSGYYRKCVILSEVNFKTLL